MSRTNDKAKGNVASNNASATTQPLNTAGKTPEELRAEAERLQKEAEKAEKAAKKAAKEAKKRAKKAEKEAEAAKAKAIADAKASGKYREAYLPKMADGSLGKPFASPHLAEQASPIGKAELRLCWGAPDGPLGEVLTPEEMASFVH